LASSDFTTMCDVAVDREVAISLADPCGALDPSIPCASNLPNFSWSWEKTP
jgi:hypothetical protein